MSEETSGAAATTPRPVILIVDDSDDIRELLGALLKKYYDVRLAANGRQALQCAAQTPQPHLILLDVEMPGGNGYQVCKRLKDDPVTRGIPVIFISGRAEKQDGARGFELGGVDYVEKPIKPPIVVARVRTHLAAYENLRQLEALVADRTMELHGIRQELIRRLSRAMEVRDGNLTHRVIRVSQYVKLIAQAAGARPDVCDLLMSAAPLYDIGKLGVPEVVLQKTGKLNQKEWEEVRKHPEIGARIIGEHKDPLLKLARMMALTHHERWDGTGYPSKLSGELIPLPGRVMAIADAFEAMTTTQRYRPPMTIEQAAADIASEARTHFDPKLVEAFQKALPKMIIVLKAVHDELEGIHDLDFMELVATPASVPANKMASRPAGSPASTKTSTPRPSAGTPARRSSPKK
jgi:putative two-component system response regulator